MESGAVGARGARESTPSGATGLGGRRTGSPAWGMTMYGLYIVRRTQIYLDPGQADALVERARVHGTTMSHVIREAIASYLARPEQEGERLARFRAALDMSFGTAPGLSPGAEYVERMRTADREREVAIDRRARR